MSRSGYVEIGVDGERPEGSRLLVPLPPNTVTQVFHGAELPACTRKQVIVDTSGAQKAVLLEGTAAGPLRIGYRFSLRRGSDPLTELGASQNRFQSAPAELVHAFAALGAGDMPKRKRVAHIAAYVGSRFEYLGVRPDGEFPPLSCDILTGNCLSINAVFLALLAMAEIPSAYHVGYFFEDGEKRADGMHCWVKTMTEGKYESWDIGHILKRRLGPVRAAENPVPGRRFTISLGRNLSFVIGGRPVVSKFLVDPIWVDKEGGAVVARAQAVLRPSRGRVVDVPCCAEMG